MATKEYWLCDVCNSKIEEYHKRSIGIITFNTNNMLRPGVTSGPADLCEDCTINLSTIIGAYINSKKKEVK